MESVWCQGITKPRFEKLNENKSTDVLIIGGGIAGILCAFKLNQAGIDCILAEAKEICSGTTGNTTAKITLSHGLVYDKMLKRFGEEKSKLYIDAQVKAIREYKSLCADIDCDFENKDSYVYSLCDRAKIEREILALQRLGYAAEFSYADELPISVAGAVRFKNQAEFHPLKFLYGISKDLPIFEHTKIVDLQPNKAKTNQCLINFKRLIIATHFPILNKHGLYPMKLYQHRSYVVALKGAGKIDGMYVDESHKGLSFRSYGDIILLGGGAHRTGKQGGCWQELEDFTKRHYKNAKIVEKWAAQDCMSLDEIPYIGQYSKATPDVYVATGFNKWGITNSLVGANILCDLITGKDVEYKEVFAPSRSLLCPQLAVNAFESVKGLLTPTVPRCPHLGCALKYNRAEHSWDCSCHGSRFSKTGELLDNPATDDKDNMPNAE